MSIFHGSVRLPNAHALLPNDIDNSNASIFSILTMR